MPYLLFSLIVFTENYFINLMSGVSNYNQVMKLACFLRVSPIVVDDLKREYGGDAVLLGTKILTAWKSNLTYDNVEEARLELSEALRKVGMGQKAKEICPQMSKPCPSISDTVANCNNFKLSESILIFLPI